MALSRLDSEKVEEGVNNLLKLFDGRVNKSEILLESSEPIYLQIDFVKIPRMRKTVVRIPLLNSLLTDTSEVCLIVADSIRGRNVNHEITINHYRRLLQKRGVTDAQKLTILPSRQIRVEYSQFEARRKLCNMYDIFLIDNKISSFLFPKLGKEFFKSRKWPIPIRIKRKNLKDEILSKLKKTSLALDGAGTTKTVQIGHIGMTSREIAENIISAGFYILKNFPGGWNNIRSLHIKGRRTAALPIYMSLISPNEVPIPKIKRKKKKSVLAVGELSSVGGRVTVYRSGDVKVHHDLPDDDSEDTYDTEEDEANVDEKNIEKNVKRPTSTSQKRQQSHENRVEKIEGKESSGEDEDENCAEDDAEAQYLFRIQKDEEEEEERKKSDAKIDENSKHDNSKRLKNKKSKTLQNAEIHQTRKRKKTASDPSTKDVSKKKLKTK